MSSSYLLLRLKSNFHYEESTNLFEIHEIKIGKLLGGLIFPRHTQILLKGSLIVWDVSYKSSRKKTFRKIEWKCASISEDCAENLKMLRTQTHERGHLGLKMQTWTKFQLVKNVQRDFCLLGNLLCIFIEFSFFEQGFKVWTLRCWNFKEFRQSKKNERLLQSSVR